MLVTAQPDSLGPSIRRLRHISRVIFRNLKVDSITGPIDCYYTLSLPDESQPFYTSGVALTTLNPSWVALPDGLFKDSHLAIRKEFRFRLFKKAAKPVLGGKGSEDEVVFESDVEMRSLERIHASRQPLSARSLPRLPENSVLFFLSDGIYTVERVHSWIKKNKPKEKNVTPSLFDSAHDTSKETHSVNAITVDDILNNVNRAQEYEVKLRAVQADTAATQAAIERLVQIEAAKLQKLHDNQVRAKRIAELKVMLAEESAQLAKDRKRVADVRMTLAPRAKLLAEHSRTLLKQKQDIEELRRRISHAKKVTLEAVTVKVEARRRKLLHNLAFIYPLVAAKSPKPPIPNQVSPDRTLLIRQLPIPLNNLTGCEDESISTALGYVAHMVCMLSKYLEVPLRYRIIYMSSRSAVSDDVHEFSQCPLYFKNGSEDKRFKFGCFMLNKNLEHLLNMCFPDWQKQAGRQTSTLENLRLLLSSQVPALQYDGM